MMGECDLVVLLPREDRVEDPSCVWCPVHTTLSRLRRYPGLTERVCLKVRRENPERESVIHISTVCFYPSQNNFVKFVSRLEIHILFIMKR